MLAREPFSGTARTYRHGKRQLQLRWPKIRRAGVAVCYRRRLLCSRAAAVRGLGRFDPLAALLSGVDVPRDDHFGAAQEPLGIFHWNFRGGPVGLHEHLRDDVLLQWSAAAFALDPYRPPRPSGFV